LTSASHPLLATPQAFAYDPVGNRTTGGSVVNAGNQLTADANYGYQYDDSGNLTRKTLLAIGNYSQYTYDAENRLTKAEEFAAGNPTTIATSTYRYDGLGRRIEKVANGQTRRYVYDGEDILLEYDGANVLQARYTYGPGIDEPIAVTKAGSTFFYHQDGLGTVTELTDANGAVAKAYAYDAYGNIVDQTGTVEQPYTYTGHEFDTESGLYHARARFYDSMVGQFFQKDSRGLDRGELNLYQYVLDNPVNLDDPLGEFPRRPHRPIRPLTDTLRPAYACVTQVRDDVWLQAGSQGWRNNDKRVHCVVSCEVGKQCGTAVGFFAGVAREAYQLTLKGYIFDPAQRRDSVLDERANIFGLTCPLAQDCYQRCITRY
jgi:RHS repeat-associated protein